MGQLPKGVCDMETHHSRGYSCDPCQTDHGPEPFAGTIVGMARQNQNFRTAFWTGDRLQMTLMSIPPCGEIGAEMHPDTEQFIRVEEGRAVVRMGECKEKLDVQHHLCAGDAVFVPCGTWHNILNSGRCPLKLSSVYAPSQHARGTIHRTKGDSEGEEP